MFRSPVSICRSLIAPLAALVLACDGSSPTASGGSGCGPWPSQESSPYVLPYPAGQAYLVAQGNCTSATHVLGTRDQYAYDFAMPIGSTVVAAASGAVGELEERFEDGNGIVTESNYILLWQDDGNASVYFHLTKNGALVEVGQSVEQGQPIALSGRTGGRGTIQPHLHFGVLGGGGFTIPVTFGNTVAHPSGLQPGVSYLALGGATLRARGTKRPGAPTIAGPGLERPLRPSSNRSRPRGAGQRSPARRRP